MRLASFFSGIGGFDLGFQKSGYEIVFQCEIDPYCQEILNNHWPEVLLHDDITTLTPIEIPDAEVWSAGWPCQDISNANVQRLGIKGKRSGLFYPFIELVKEIRPKWIILENVLGLLSSNKGKAFGSIINEIQKIGYLGGWTMCNTLDFGLPQNRKRIIIIASYKNSNSHKVIANCLCLPRNNSKGNQKWAKNRTNISQSIKRKYPVVVQRRGGFGYTQGNHICPTLRSGGEKHQGSPSDRPILCGEKLNVGRMGKIDGVSRQLDSYRGRLIGNSIAVSISQWFAKEIINVEENKWKS